MNNIIKSYINSLSKEDIKRFSINKSIFLENDEIDTIYTIIKNNYEDLLKDPHIIDNYKSYFHNDNFIKIKKVFMEYFSKYQRFL